MYSADLFGNKFPALPAFTTHRIMNRYTRYCVHPKKSFT